MVSKVGSAEGTGTEHNRGGTSLMAYQNLQETPHQALSLQGVLNDEVCGHVDAAILEQYISEDEQPFAGTSLPSWTSTPLHP